MHIKFEYYLIFFALDTFCGIQLILIIVIFANYFSEPDVRHHLVRVYGCLTATTLAASLGAAIYLFGIFEAGFLAAIGSVGLAIYLSFSQNDPKTFYTRLGALLAFGFLTGNSIGPLLEMVISIDPAIVVTALVGTSVVFISLSASAMFAQRGSYLFLGGILMSVLSTMALFGLFNIFIQSRMLYQVRSSHFCFRLNYSFQLLLLGNSCLLFV